MTIERPGEPHYFAPFARFPAAGGAGFGAAGGFAALDFAGLRVGAGFAGPTGFLAGGPCRDLRATAGFADLPAGAGFSRGSGFAAAAGLALPRRAGRPSPTRSARAASKASASSSVIASGVLSRGRVALMPSWLT
jgi:hypothetical protein